MKILSIIGAVLLASATAAAQSVPEAVTFTARIVDNGVPATGDHEVAFRLFDAATGGAEVWSEATATVTIEDGLLYRELGASVPLDATVFAGGKRWLEMEIDGTVMTPRVAIVSVPYAVRSDVASVAETLEGLSSSDFVTSVTASDGLTGGGAGGDLSLGVAFSGSGSAVTAARSDHTHVGQYLPVGASLICGAGDVVVGIDPTSGDLVCATPSSSGDPTADTIADDDVIQLGVETAGDYDWTPDTIADDNMIELGVETFGAFDSTEDTIADDGLIDDTEVADAITINGSIFAPAAAGNVGVGTTSPNGAFQIARSADIVNSCGGSTLRTDMNALVFANDPFGGCGDHGWIGLKSRGGESMDLEIAVLNDSDDNIILNASGAVGIGVASPSGAELVVAGPATGTVLSDGFEDGTIDPFTSAGAAWFVSTSSPGTDLNSAESGDIGDYGGTTLQTTVVLGAPGLISFQARVSSEPGWDYLRFYLDGVEKFAISGETSWSTYSYGVASGSHTLQWSYSKDSSLSYGSDSAFVDAVLVQEHNSNAIATLGRVGVGTTDPVDMLQVAGDIRVGTGTTGCVKDADGTAIAGTCSSDERLKDNITPFAPALERLVQLQAVDYDWRKAEFPGRHFGEARSFGLIAQDTERLFPDLVVEDAEGYKAVKYSKLPLYLLQGLKEEHAQVARLRAENAALERRLIAVEQRLGMAPKTASTWHATAGVGLAAFAGVFGLLVLVRRRRS